MIFCVLVSFFFICITTVLTKENTVDNYFYRFTLNASKYQYYPQCHLICLQFLNNTSPSLIMPLQLEFRAIAFSVHTYPTNIESVRSILNVYNFIFVQNPK